MQRNKSPFVRPLDSGSDSDGAPPKFNRPQPLQSQKQVAFNFEPVTPVSPARSSDPDLLDNLAESNSDRQIFSFEGLVEYCKSQFKDVFSVLRSAKNRIMKVERSAASVTTRMTNI